MEMGGYVYILASKYKRLYTGATSQLKSRVAQHKSRSHPESYTARYEIDCLVYFESFATLDEAKTREAVVKSMPREEKLVLIESSNPSWRDLADTLPDAAEAAANPAASTQTR